MSLDLNNDILLKDLFQDGHLLADSICWAEWFRGTATKVSRNEMPRNSRVCVRYSPLLELLEK